MKRHEKVQQVRKTLKKLVPPRLTVEDVGTSGFILREGDKVIAYTTPNGVHMSSVTILVQNNDINDISMVQQACEDHKCDYRKFFNQELDLEDWRSRIKRWK